MKTTNRTKSSYSGQLTAKHLGSNKVIPQGIVNRVVSDRASPEGQGAGVLSTNQIGAEIVNFGNRLNPNVNAINTNTLPSYDRSQSRNVRKPLVRTLQSKDILIYPQVVVIRGNANGGSNSQNGSHDISFPSHSYPPMQQPKSNMNNYPKHRIVQSGGSEQYSGNTGNSAALSQPKSSQRSIVLLSNHKRSGDAFNRKHDFQDIYAQEDNADVEYDLISPEVSYFDTATKITPHERANDQKSLVYQNEVVNDRKVGPRKQNVQPLESKIINFLNCFLNLALHFLLLLCFENNLC